MSSPITPNDVKSAIPSTTGDFCSKFSAFLKIPQILYQIVSYMFGEDGKIGVDFKADLCALDCNGVGNGTGTGTGTGGGGSGSGLGTPTITATDGAFNDHVHLDWTSITFATSYQLLRNTVNNPDTAAIIASPTTNSYDDTGVTPGTLYYYWVKAINATATGARSAADTGYAATVLTSVTDLDCTKGIQSFASTTPAISLVWTNPAGATAYDIYRATTNNFGAATLIDGNRTPFDNSRNSKPCVPFPCVHNLFVDNGAGDLVYTDSPPNAQSTFYYWVVPKIVSGGITLAIGSHSNVGQGWSAGDGVRGDYIVSGTLSVPNQTFTFPAGVTKCWVSLIAPGGGGAGGDAGFGGGGGGAGAVVTGMLSVAPGKKIKFVVGAIASGGNGSTSGTNATVAKLQYDGSGSFVDIITTTPALGGIWDALGGGGGGAGGTATVDPSLSPSYNKPGSDGGQADGTMGGRGGRYFGSFRSPANNLNGSSGATSTGQGSTGGGGGGSDAFPTSPGAAHGANAAQGGVAFTYYP